MTPKSLLRHKGAVSELADIGPTSAFKPIIADQPEIFTRAKRHVFCTGKVYYDLVDKRRTLGLDQGDNPVSINRIEQLYPFPQAEIATLMASNPNANIIWCQEEPVNMGAWTFVDRRFEAIINNRIGYAGRSESASPSTGYPHRHAQEQEALLLDALSLRHN